VYRASSWSERRDSNSIPSASSDSSDKAEELTTTENPSPYESKSKHNQVSEYEFRIFAHPISITPFLLLSQMNILQ
jgi:hypothetical protein